MVATKESNEVRNQLHTIQIENLTPAQIESAAGGVYLSRNEQGTQLDTQCIVKSFQSVKVPTLGALIPNTCAISQSIGTAGFTSPLTPDTNKSYALYGADVGAQGGTVQVDFGLLDGTGRFILLAVSGSLSDGSTGALDYRHPVFFDSDVVPAFRVNAGTVEHAVCGIAYGEVVQ
jgi:hypothetical protein